MSEVSDYWKPEVERLQETLSITASENTRLRALLARARRVIHNLIEDDDVDDLMDDFDDANGVVKDIDAELKAK